MPKPLFTTLRITLLGFSLSLIFTGNAWAKDCTEAEINRYVRSNDPYGLIECGAEAVPALINLLKVETPETRRRAIEALQYYVGSDSEAIRLALIESLKDKDAKVRVTAAYALGVLSTEYQEVVPVLIDALKDENPVVRSDAAEALVLFGENSKIAIPALIEALKDENPVVRGNSVLVFQSIGTEAKAAEPALINALKDENAIVRGLAAFALGRIGAEDKAAVPLLIAALDDKINGVRESAAYALELFGTKDGNVIPALIKTLGDEDETVRNEAANSLGNITTRLYEQAKTLQQVGEAEEVIRQIHHALNSQEEFKDACLRTEQSLEALNDKRQLLLLTTASQWLSAGKNVWLSHAAFWFALIFAYPKSPQIQAIFFWNPWVRKIMGLGYVGFALTWVPFLRRSLFAPFRESLLADAGLDNFKPEAYFENSEVKNPNSGDIKPIREAIPGFKGQIVLEGASGLGKTMFLRHLCQQSKRVVVYLPATKCADGVIEAIQKKLHGEEIKDPKFLQNLIYSGAIAICIDGLNEVSADTRAKIVEFTENYFKGDIILAAQPMEWTPPATAKKYVMQPLGRSHIQAFLLSRKTLIPDYAPVRGEAYEQACSRYLKQVLNEQQTSEELEATQRILSNPMDLTVIASMLAADKHPDLLRLQEQQYRVMTEEYQEKHLGQEFPLDSFSEAVYQMRLKDETALPEAQFLEELLGMERHKMVVSRQVNDRDGKPAREWYFRHDKIAEFFILQTFLEHPERQEQHLGDPRFRGVYFMLASFLKLEDAIALREMLIQYAADTKDHTVSDTFVHLLRSRKTHLIQTAL